MKNVLWRFVISLLFYTSCVDKEPILLTEIIYNDEDDVVEERFFGFEYSLMLLDFKDKDLKNYSTDCSQEPRFLPVRFNYKNHPNLIPLYSKKSDFGQNDDFNIFIHPFKYEILDFNGYLKTKIDIKIEVGAAKVVYDTTNYKPCVKELLSKNLKKISLTDTIKIMQRSHRFQSFGTSKENKYFITRTVEMTNYSDKVIIKMQPFEGLDTFPRSAFTEVLNKDLIFREQFIREDTLWLGESQRFFKTEGRKKYEFGFENYQNDGTCGDYAELINQ